MLLVVVVRCDADPLLDVEVRFSRFVFVNDFVLSDSNILVSSSKLTRDYHVINEVKH